MEQVTATESMIEYSKALREAILHGLDPEAEAVKVQTAFVDRAIAGTLEGVQNDFYLVPKREVLEEQVVGIKTDDDLAAAYWAAVNN